MKRNHITPTDYSKLQHEQALIALGHVNVFPPFYLSDKAALRLHIVVALSETVK